MCVSFFYGLPEIQVPEKARNANISGFKVKTTCEKGLRQLAGPTVYWPERVAAPDLHCRLQKPECSVRPRLC